MDEPPNTDDWTHAEATECAYAILNHIQPYLIDVLVKTMLGMQRPAKTITRRAPPVTRPKTTTDAAIECVIASASPLSPADVATITGRNYDAVKRALLRAHAAGRICKNTDGYSR